MHRALLICNSYYPLDPAQLPGLLGPRSDGVLLWAALTHRDEGLFHPGTVQLLYERGNREILSACESFLKDAASSDDLLLYFSGHAIVGGGHLYWCAADTIASKPMSTAVDAEQVSQLISSSVAGSITIILDCCFSGAFKGSSSAQLGGVGRYVISATTQAETAQDAVEMGAPSPFTGALLASLSHDADPDESGLVDLDAIYRAILEHKDLKVLSTVERDFDGSGSPHLARRILTEALPRRGAEPTEPSAVESAASVIPAMKWRRRMHGDYVKADMRTWIYFCILAIILSASVLGSYLRVAQYYYSTDRENIKNLTEMVTLAAILPAALCLIIGLLNYKWQRGLRETSSRRSQLQNMNLKSARVGLWMRIPVLVISLCILLVPITGIGLVTAPWVVVSGLLALLCLESLAALSRRGDQLAVASTALLAIVQLVPIYSRMWDGSNSGFHNGLEFSFGWAAVVLGFIGVIWWAFAGGPAGYWVVATGSAIIIASSIPQALDTFSPHLVLIAVSFGGLILAILLGAGRPISIENGRESQFTGMT